MPQRSYYELLEVAASADIQAIKQAYRQQIRRYHPDKFAGQRAQLKRGGDAVALRTLDHQIEITQQITQRINEAYAVLVDPGKRAAYDRQLSEQRMATYREEIRRTRHPEYERRTVKSRPHRRNPTRSTKSDAIPWPLLIALVFAAACAFSWVSGMLVNRRDTAQNFSPSGATAVGMITAYDLQATESAQQATYSARIQIANLPTATPRSAAANERSADVLYELGNYPYAVELYGQAIELEPHAPHLYSKRGFAYTGLFAEGDMTAAELALADFEQALQLDSDWDEAYRGRGLLYYADWQLSAEPDLAELALADLEHYTTLIDSPDEQVNAALVVLRLAEAK